jgi:hypothetical protein
MREPTTSNEIPHLYNLNSYAYFRSDYTLPCGNPLILLTSWNCLVLCSWCYFTTLLFRIWVPVYETDNGTCEILLVATMKCWKKIFYIVSWTFRIQNCVFRCKSCISEPGSVQSVRFEMVCRRQRGFSLEILRYPARLAPPCGCKMHGSISPCWMKKLGKQS